MWATTRDPGGGVGLEAQSMVALAQLTRERGGRLVVTALDSGSRFILFLDGC